MNAQVNPDRISGEVNGVRLITFLAKSLEEAQRRVPISHFTHEDCLRACAGRVRAVIEGSWDPNMGFGEFLLIKQAAHAHLQGLESRDDTFAQLYDKLVWMGATALLDLAMTEVMICRMSHEMQLTGRMMASPTASKLLQEVGFVVAAIDIAAAHPEEWHFTNVAIARSYGSPGAVQARITELRRTHDAAHIAAIRAFIERALVEAKPTQKEG